MDQGINNANLNDSDLLSGCLYIDINDIQEYLTLKLVFLVTNYKQVVASSEHLDLPILTYKNNECFIPLNN